MKKPKLTVQASGIDKLHIEFPSQEAFKAFTSWLREQKIAAVQVLREHFSGYSAYHLSGDAKKIKAWVSGFSEASVPPPTPKPFDFADGKTDCTISVTFFGKSKTPLYGIKLMDVKADGEGAGACFIKIFPIRSEADTKKIMDLKPELERVCLTVECMDEKEKRVVKHLTATGLWGLKVACTLGYGLMIYYSKLEETRP
jgi:hypothetical protein